MLCRWINHNQPVAAPAGLSGADQVAQHYLYAPMWMKHSQPLGTAGSDVQALDNAPTAAYSRVADVINDAKEPHIKSGKALSFEAVRAWFVPRYAAWKADPSKAISVKDVVAFVKADAAWVSPKDIRQGSTEIIGEAHHDQHDGAQQNHGAAKL